MGLRKGKKKNAQNPPAPGLPLPPLAGLPMPAPGVLPSPLPAAPLPLPLPAAPLPLPQATLPVAAAPTTLPSIPAPLPLPEASLTAAEPASSNEYGSMWAKRSDKPLQQIYGHIDRLAKGETGSLLDRYSERFGHSLDREIIVLRKKEHDSKVSEIRDAPVVELLDADGESDGLQSQLTAVEQELRELKPEYQAAKSSGDVELLAHLRPVLEGLMSERKLIIAMMNEESEPIVAEEAMHSDASVDDEDLFLSFVSIVDDLLGSDLSEEVVSAFIESDEFEVYQEVASDASSANEDLRRQFVAIVDGQLGNMNEESINAFVESSNFEIYSTVATLYQSDDS